MKLTIYTVNHGIYHNTNTNLNPILNPNPNQHVYRQVDTVSATSPVHSTGWLCYSCQLAFTQTQSTVVVVGIEWAAPLAWMVCWYYLWPGGVPEKSP